jgi:NAD(P) transhydrogenase subunit beta
VIVPGYGMAVAQAQHASAIWPICSSRRAWTVEFAVHPVAGRMPGHMNVLLAEAKVPYDKLKEMDESTRPSAQTDVVLVIGANDVVNPVARTDPDSPSPACRSSTSTRPAPCVVVKRSLSPGFAGIPNPLFAATTRLMFFGDGKKAMLDLVAALKER